MKNLRAILFCAAALAGALFCRPARAENAAAGDRYLFIVETARTMKPQLPAARLCVQQMLASGMSGQLRAGDTLGLWTYDSDLHAGQFPMQVWDTASAKDIARQADDFLKQQRCHNSARNAEMLAAMFQVIKISDAVTVLIFSDGGQQVRDTPFDAAINKIYAEHRNELRTAQIPFVTVLQARGGKIFYYSVNPASGPVKILKLTAPPNLAPDAARPATAPLPAPVKTNVPLIVDYSKSSGSPATVEFETAKSNPAVRQVELAATSSAEPMNEDEMTASSQAVVQAVSPAGRRQPLIVIGTPAMAAPPRTNVPAAGGGGETSRKISAGLMVVIIFFGALVLMAGWVLVRRRAALRRSLITESFERRRK